METQAFQARSSDELTALLVDRFKVTPERARAFVAFKIGKRRTWLVDTSEAGLIAVKKTESPIVFSIIATMVRVRDRVTQVTEEKPDLRLRASEETTHRSVKPGLQGVTNNGGVLRKPLPIYSR